MKEKTKSTLHVLLKVAACAAGGLLMLAVIYLQDCGFYGQTCSAPTKIFGPPIAIILAVTLLISVVLSYFCYIMYLRVNEKAIWPVILVSIAVVGFVLYQKLVQPRLLEKKFKNQFTSEYFEPTYLPEGYRLKYSIYKFSGDSGVHGPGNMLERRYEKVAGIDGNGDEYTVNLVIKMGDAQNDAMGVLDYCESGKCDVIDGKNVNNIHCQKANSEICAVKIGRTYISVDYSNKPPSRSESIRTLDSMKLVH